MLVIVILFMNVNVNGGLTYEDLKTGHTYNWMGAGEYNKPSKTGFASIFNANRVFKLKPKLKNEEIL